MKFSFYFDVAMCVSTHRKSVMTTKNSAMESSGVKDENPREGRYFTKPSEEEIQKVVGENPSEEEEIPNTEPTPEDAGEDITSENPAEEKPIGEEIPNPEIELEEEPVDEEPDPITTSAPEEDDEDYAGESSITAESEIAEESSTIDSLLNMFTYTDTDTVQEEDAPAEEAVGRETPAIPSVMRRIEGEGDEHPIPLNASVELKKETADPKVDTETYVDKAEESNKKKAMKMIANFTNLSISRKKSSANEIYQFILDNNVDIDLSKFRTIWKLVDHPFIESKN